MLPDYEDDEPELPQEEEQDERRPSKSARKRAAHAAQALGEALIQLKLHELDTLKLPEALYDAVREAQRIRNSRGGLARQRQYIGKLMREIDTAPIEVAIAHRRKTGALPS
jgi:ribosome-associated protein